MGRVVLPVGVRFGRASKSASPARGECEWKEPAGLADAPPNLKS